MDNDSRIFLAGHNGLVGSAILRKLKKEGYNNVILADRSVDLRKYNEVSSFISESRPDYIICAAAKVGGILGNRDYKAEIIFDNLMIQSNMIDLAWDWRVKKLLFLGSSCIYPKHAPIPIKESSLLTGPLEPTNDAYAIAKIAGIKMCQSYHEQYGCNFISAMPCNLYGPGDNFHPEKSHVLPGMIRRFHKAKEENLPTVTCWGDGSPLREFLHVDDLASACIHLMNNYDDPQQIINVGTGIEVSIKELAETIADVVGYEGLIMWDTEKPNGTMRKVMDTSRIKATGWEPKVSLREGIEFTYAWFVDSMGGIRGMDDEVNEILKKNCCEGCGGE
jgi:GDP-L-fucose synthase|tara:strand:+ start:4042 stop:5043 length:1002 start_codon:yes stop_codon:yes gene_type:complete